MSLDDRDDAAHWRATFRDPSYVRAECPAIVGMIKALAKRMKLLTDPEDWGQELMRLVRELRAEDRAHLPHEIGFIHELHLGQGAALRLFTKLGLPANLFEAAHDSPETFLDLLLVDLELGSQVRIGAGSRLYSRLTCSYLTSRRSRRITELVGLGSRSEAKRLHATLRGSSRVSRTGVSERFE